MVDIDLLVHELRLHGHTADHGHYLPDNAGGYQLMVDGKPLTLEQARDVLDADEAKKRTNS